MPQRVYRIFGEGVGLMNRRGEVVVEPRYAQLGECSDNRCPFRDDTGKWGYFDAAGKPAIEPRFDAVGPFSEGLAGAVEADRQGFIDANGRWQFTTSLPVEDGVVESVFRGGLAEVRLDDRLAFVDRRGKLAFVLDALQTWGFEEGLAAVAVSDESWGYIDSHGAWVVKPTYRWAHSFSQGLAQVELRRGREQLSGYIDAEGMLLIEPHLESASPFSQGLAAVTLDGAEYGFIDRRGKWKIQPQFEEAEPFSEGLAAVRQQGPIVFIDKRGEVVLRSDDTPWHAAQPFRGGLALVASEGRYAYIDTSGRVVWRQA